MNIKTKIKKNQKKYNKLISYKVKFIKKRDDCDINKEYKLHNAATFLIKQTLHQEKLILTDNQLVTKSEEDQLTQLKLEGNYYSTRFKPIKILEILPDNNYRK